MNAQTGSLRHFADKIKSVSVMQKFSARSFRTDGITGFCKLDHNYVWISVNPLGNISLGTDTLQNAQIFDKFVPF